MAKDLRTSLKVPVARGLKWPVQKGFSLVELLVAAFILAIGILGLAMLQTMALRANRNSINMVTAARLAARVMDQAELEGRLSWLNITDSNRTRPTLADLKNFGLKYIVISDERTEVEVFNLEGGLVEIDSGDPRRNRPFFTVTTSRVPVPTTGGPNAVGHLSDIQVRVTFTDTVDHTNQQITRSFNLTRRVIHG